MVRLGVLCLQHSIKTVSQALSLPHQSAVTTQGWLRSVRQHKQVVFAELNDGLSGERLQLVFDPTPEAKALRQNSFVEVTGDLVHVTGRTQSVELQCKQLSLVRRSTAEADEYPFRCSESTDWEAGRQHVTLRPRLARYAALLRARAGLTWLLHRHLRDTCHFLHVHTPVLTGNDCEGAGSVFTVTQDGDQDEDDRRFFDKPVHLTVSGQLHLEAIAGGVTRVYCLGPAFRAELSRTRRHLAEFYMLEAEMAGVTRSDQLIAHLQQLVCDVTREFVQRHRDDMQAMLTTEQFNDVTTRLERILERPFPCVTYSEALQTLASVDGLPRLEHGDDLQRSHELALIESCGDVPVFVTRWPTNVKPFYVKRDATGDWADSVDLLVPGVGELVGGSVREDDAATLHRRLSSEGLLPALQWYLDLRRFGTPPTAGYGLGFERLLLFLTGLQSLRDVVPFPRWYGHCPS